MLLMVNVSYQEHASILTSTVSLQDPLQCLKGLFRVYSGRFLSYSKKISQNEHSLSLVVISLSLVVIRCPSLYHRLSLVVTRRITRLSFYKLSKQQNKLKSSLLLKKSTNMLRANILRILRIQNAKFSGYYFYMNTNIWRNFQICISVPSKEKLQ